MTLRPRFGERVVIVFLALGLLAAPAPTSAADGDSDEKPVSTSPMTTRSSDQEARPGQSPIRTLTPPLTRAAARRKVETITPADWLARFGSVEIERRE